MRRIRSKFLLGNGWQNYPIAIRFIYTYPQPVTAKTGSAPWSNFNRYGWSIFARRQQLAAHMLKPTK
jgi:hypothetical protein